MGEFLCRRAGIYTRLAGSCSVLYIGLVTSQRGQDALTNAAWRYHSSYPDRDVYRGVGVSGFRFALRKRARKGIVEMFFATVKE